MFTRRFAGIWGIVSFTIMTAVVTGFLVIFELPPVIIWAGALFTGGLLLLQIISAFKGSRQRSQEFSTFEHNSLGNPITEEFIPLYNRPIPFQQNESVIAYYAPVQKTGFSDFFRGFFGFLGKAKITDAENALILTQKRLLFIMIGPEELKQFSSSPKVTTLLETLPGGASAKRRMLWTVGAAEIHETLSGLLEERSLEQVADSVYSFSIPLSDIHSIDHSMKFRSLTIRLEGLNLSYNLKTEVELTQLTEKLARLIK